MTTKEECRECRAGLQQAINCDIAWHCPDHGIQRLDVSAILAALAWYADVGNYDSHAAPGTLDPQTGEWFTDGGARALAALKET